jgi:hypothetical protein
MFKEYLLYDAKCIFHSQRYNPWGSLVSLTQKRKMIIKIPRKVLKQINRQVLSNISLVGIKWDTF